MTGDPQLRVEIHTAHKDENKGVQSSGCRVGHESRVTSLNMVTTKLSSFWSQLK